MLPVAGIFLVAGGFVAQDGRDVFGEYCSIPYCHGAGGGEGRAPALRGRSWHEEDLRRIIQEGVPDTSMPPFGDRLAPEELSSLIEFIRSISIGVDSSGRDVGRTSDRAPWDAAAGRALFHEGGCAHCHRFGRDDRPGPDLSRAAERKPFEILRDIVEPGAETSSGKLFLRVETSSGESFRAIREEERESYVRVHDLSTAPPVLRRIPKAEIVRIEPLSGSAMPADPWQRFDAKQLLDLVFHVRSKGGAENTVPEVATRPVDIWSDGTRLSGDLFYPTGRTGRLPAIVMSHGWGGLRSHLNEAYAPYFAAEGFVVLTFDYRGWGESDGRLILIEGKPTAVREVVDPWDQTEDIIHALRFIEGEEIVDPERIGYWGSSYSGGHAVWVAAHDPRVKAIVAQVPAMDSVEFVAAMDGGVEEAHRQEIRRARGEIPPLPFDAPPLGDLQGHPYASRMARYSPRAVADRVRVPTLILDAGNEELFDIREHGRKVYETVKENAPAKYHVFAGITHYGIYREKRPEAIALAVGWFREHLGERPGQSP